MERVGSEDQLVALPILTIQDVQADQTACVLRPHQERSFEQNTQRSQDSNEYVFVNDPIDTVDEPNHSANDDGNDDESDNDDTVEPDDGAEDHLIPNERHGWLLINPRFLSLTPNHESHCRLLFVHGLPRDSYRTHATHDASSLFFSGIQTPDSMYPEPSSSTQQSTPESSMVLSPLCANQVSLLLHTGQQFPNGPLRMTPPTALSRALIFGSDGVLTAEDMDDGT